MSSRLYKLALWYIKKCNAKWENQHKEKVESLTRQQAIDEFVEKICEKYTEEERKGNYKQYCVEIKQNIADIAEQLKG